MISMTFSKYLSSVPTVRIYDMPSFMQSSKPFSGLFRSPPSRDDSVNQQACVIYIIKRRNNQRSNTKSTSSEGKSCSNSKSINVRLNVSIFRTVVYIIRTMPFLFVRIDLTIKLRSMVLYTIPWLKYRESGKGQQWV